VVAIGVCVIVEQVVAGHRFEAVAVAGGTHAMADGAFEMGSQRYLTMINTSSSRHIGGPVGRVAMAKGTIEGKCRD